MEVARKESAGDVEGVVAGFFAGKDVLVTGASGFLGRVLLEKLLREAPRVGTVFVLLRPKRGRSPQQRLVHFTDVSLFERLRREQPQAMGKLRAVQGDVSLPALGLSADDRALLQERVAVVFHAAASVRFDDPLRKAVLVNVRGTRDLCELATAMPRLQAFVYVSTAYSSFGRSTIEERLYPPPGDWRTHIHAAETMDHFTHDVLSIKVLGHYINTYLFAKALAEHVVNDYRHKLPVGIIRPSIVIYSEVEPFPGWMDNFNGPGSLLWVGLLGASHVFLYDTTKYLDVIPVDYVVGGILLAALYIGNERKPEILPIFNASSTDRHLYNMAELVKSELILSTENKVQRIYKIYSIFVRTELLYRILFILLDLPISITIDAIAWLLKKERKMLKLHRRTIVGTLKIAYFCFNTLKIPNKNFLALTDLLGPQESKRFNLSTEAIHVEPFLWSSVRETKKYFFPHHQVNPGKQDAMLEIIHYMICGTLLFLIWKSELMSHITWFLLNILKFLLSM